MGVDLTLLPHKHHHTSGTPILTESLRLDRDASLFDSIRRASREHGRVAGVVSVQDDDAGWRNTDADNYGAPLRYVRAGDLSRMLGSTSGDTPWNIAVVAFVHALPRDVPIYLWWT